MNVRGRVREHVPATTAILSVLSLALVFSVALQAFPAGVLPSAPDSVLAAIPHLNAVISAAAIGTILSGVRAIRRGRVRRHRALMVLSFLLFGTFLVLYLYRVGLVGPTPFPGPDSVYRFVYLPLLSVHVLLAIVSVPLVYYVLLLGATRPIAAVYDSNHARAGRVAASLWLISFVLGIVVYLLLYVVY